MTGMTTSTAERHRGARATRSGSAPRPALWRLAGEWLDRPLASFHLLMAVFVLMLGFGLTMVLSSSAATAFRNDDSAFAVFVNQATFAVLGLVAFFFTMRMPLRLMRSVSTTAVIVEKRYGLPMSIDAPPLKPASRIPAAAAKIALTE